MATRTVGTSGADYPFTQQGLMDAIAWASTGDVIRLISSGTIDLVLQTYPAGIAAALNFEDKGITLESDPALFLNNDQSTLPKLRFGGGAAVKCIDNIGAGSRFNGLQIEGFSIYGNNFSSGVLQCRSKSNINGDNLRFIDCAAACVQHCAGGTWTRITGLRCGELFRNSDGLTVVLFENRVRDGFQYGINLAGTAATSAFYLGVIFLPGVDGSDRAINAGATCPIVDVSVDRDGAVAGTAFVGVVSYCTWNGFTTGISGTDGGNNQNRDPLFVDGPAGNFNWQQASLEYDSGTAVVGVTHDLLGRALPVGIGWPRGARDYLLVAAVSGAVANTPLELEVTFAQAIPLTVALETAGNWTLAQNSPANGVVPSVSAVVADGDPASSVTITTSEHTGGQSYRVTPSASIINLTGYADYAGLGTAPTVTQLEVRGPGVIRVHFSEAMKPDDPELTNASNYVFTRTGELDVPLVVSVTPQAGSTPTYVDLVVTGGRRDVAYTLRVRAT